MSSAIKSRLVHCLRQLHLSAFVCNFNQHGASAANEGCPYDRYLLNLCEMELGQPETRKVNRLLIASKLPPEKTLPTFDRSRLSAAINRRFDVLLEGDFLDRRENILGFGNPGSGKMHLPAALGHQLIQKSWLEKELRRLDKFEALIIDDVGYVQQSREEMEVLLTLLAHRYEHSLLDRTEVGL